MKPRCEAVARIINTHADRPRAQRDAEGWRCAYPAKHWLLARALCTIHRNAILRGTYVRLIDKPAPA